MVVIKKNYRKQILMLLVVLGIFAGLAGNVLVSKRLQTQIQAFSKMSELPARFVQVCQKSAVEFDLNWELLAASFQVRREHNLIESYPDSSEVINVARKIATFAKSPSKQQLIKSLGISKSLAEEVSKRTKLLQSTSFLYSANYAFPYKQKVYYTDTWGAAREGGSRTHEGTDLFAPEGTPIYAVCGGKIEKLGWNRLGGERVGVRGEDSIYFYYAHLSKINPLLRIGMTVTKGTLLGYTGHTGDALTTPDHLHFGMELQNSKWINPYNFLQYWQGR